MPFGGLSVLRRRLCVTGKADVPERDAHDFLAEQETLETLAAQEHIVVGERHSASS